MCGHITIGLIVLLFSAPFFKNNNLLEKIFAFKRYFLKIYNFFK